MAKQRGIVPLSGTLGGINLYYRKGVPIARRAGGGFNGNAIKTKLKMVRVRENASEFGHCSTVKKHYKLALNPFLCLCKGLELHSRLMQLFFALKMLDTTHTRGERRVWPGVATELGKGLLRAFVFTPRCNILQTLGGTGRYNAASRTFTMSAFAINNVRFPEGATHLALTLGLLHFNFETLAYELKQSVPLYMDPAFAEDSFSLTVAEPELAGTAVAVLGLRFYQEVNGTYSVFRDARALGVLVVGVG